MSFHIKIGNFKFTKNLGNGTFGKVKLAVHEITGHKVAVKILNKKKIKQQNVFEKVKREIKVLRHFNHPHIVKHFEFIDTPSDIFMVIEYAAGGELFDYISRKERLSEQEARHFFHQLYSAVNYCHQHKIAHRDLKPENLLLDQSQTNLKLIDFGLSNSMKDSVSLKTACGSPNYAAPEIICGRTYAGVESDVWSMGVILYAMVSGSLPFDDDSMTQLFIKIKNARYHVPNFISENVQDLISRMLQPNPIRRITMKEIREHPWFQADKAQKYLQIGENIQKHKSSYPVNQDIVKHLFAMDVVPPMMTVDQVSQHVQDKRNTEYCGIYELFNHDLNLQQLLQTQSQSKESLPLKTYFKSHTDQPYLKESQLQRINKIMSRLKTGQVSNRLRPSLLSKLSLQEPRNIRINSIASTSADSTVATEIGNLQMINTMLTDSISSDMLKQCSKQGQEAVMANQQENSSAALASKSHQWVFGLKFKEPNGLNGLMAMICDTLKEFDMEWQFSKADQKFKCRTTVLDEDLAELEDDNELLNQFVRSKFIKFQIGIYRQLNEEAKTDYFQVDMSLIRGSPLNFIHFSHTFMHSMQRKIADHFEQKNMYQQPSSVKTQKEDWLYGIISKEQYNGNSLT